MAIKDGGPAFPRQTDYRPADGEPMNGPEFGMSLRDYFAGQGLIALGSHKAVYARGIPWLAEHAYMLADAMLAEREKPDAH